MACPGPGSPSGRSSAQPWRPPASRSSRYADHSGLPFPLASFRGGRRPVSAALLRYALAAATTRAISSRAPMFRQMNKPAALNPLTGRFHPDGRPGLSRGGCGAARRGAERESGNKCMAHEFLHGPKVSFREVRWWAAIGIPAIARGAPRTIRRRRLPHPRHRRGLAGVTGGPVARIFREVNVFILIIVMRLILTCNKKIPTMYKTQLRIRSLLGA